MIISGKKKIRLLTEYRILHLLKYNRLQYTKKQLNEKIIPDVYNIDASSINRALISLVKQNKIKTEKIGTTYHYSSKKQKRLTLDYSKFKDIDSKMTFGVEFEFGCDVPDEEFKSMFKDLGIEEGIEGDSSIYMSSNNKNDYSSWTLTYDSTIETNMLGQYELISPVLKGLDGLIQLHKVTSFLNDLKKANLAHQNDSCGTHVHHGTFNANIPKLIENFTSNQNNFNEFVKKSRIINKSSEGSKKRYIMNNIYETVYNRHINFTDLVDEHCISAKKEDYYKNNSINWSHCKYFNLRLNNYKKYGTVEMRQLEGITHFTKIAFWIIIGQRTIKSSKNKVSEIRKKKNVKEFASYLGLSAIIWK